MSWYHHQRRWIKHVAANGRIGWEREGSGWITWGWDPDPPGYFKPTHLDPRERGALWTQIRLQRRAKGLDMVTGLPLTTQPINMDRFRAKRRKWLHDWYRKTFPDHTDDQRHAWVKDYLSKNSGPPDG